MTYEDYLIREKLQARMADQDWPGPLHPPSRWEWECIECGARLVEAGNRRHCPDCIEEATRQLALVQYSRMAHRLADAYASDDERRGRRMLSQWEMQRRAWRDMHGVEMPFIQ